MKRNLVLTDEEKELSNSDRYEILHPECLFFAIRESLLGNINKDDAIKKIKSFIRFYEDEFKDCPEKKDAYITGFRDAFEIFNHNLSNPVYPYPKEIERRLNVSKQIGENLLSDELWQ